MTDYETLLAAAERELKELKTRHTLIRIDLEPATALAVIGALKLASRHPGFQQQSNYSIIQKVIGLISNHFLVYPALRDLIRQGGMEEHDQ